MDDRIVTDGLPLTIVTLSIDPVKDTPEKLAEAAEIGASERWPWLTAAPVETAEAMLFRQVAADAHLRLRWLTTLPGADRALLAMYGRIPYMNGTGDIAMAQPQTRSERIEARTTPDTLAIVRRAAELQGRSVSEFVVSAAEQAARKALEEEHIVRLSAEDQLRFVEALLNPPHPAPAMQRALDHHRRLIGEQ